MARLIEGYHDVRMAESVPAATAEVKRNPPDVLLSDYDLGSLTGEELLQIVSSFFPRVRRVLVAGSGDLSEFRALVSTGLAHAVLASYQDAGALLDAVEGTHEG